MGDRLEVGGTKGWAEGANRGRGGVHVGRFNALEHFRRMVPKRLKVESGLQPHTE